MTIESFMILFLFALGAIIGSFLNVCIVRMPEEKSVVVPCSHCVNCKKTIAWFDNIPFISYLILGGKCRNCGVKISPRYLLVEFITAVSFVGFYLYFGLNILLVPYLFMMCCFIVATFVDFKYKIIPDEVSVGGMIVGLILSAFIPKMHGIDVIGQNLLIAHAKSLGISFFGLLIGGGIIYLMGVIGDIAFKKESMGGGDVKLMAMIGSIMGWKLAVLTFFIAPFFGAVFGIIEKIKTKESAIAYGPFLALGALISLFWGEKIIDFILSGYGGLI